MRNRTMRVIALVAGLLLAGPAAADLPPVALGGSRQDTQSQWRGVGKDFGHGYRRDAQGAWHGTGKAFGGGWRKDGSGNWRGTGKHFGQGRRRTP
jgi:hypothetical protein